MQLHGVEDLGSEVELRRSAGGRQHREPLRVGQVTGTVRVVLLVLQEVE